MDDLYLRNGLGKRIHVLDTQLYSRARGPFVRG